MTALSVRKMTETDIDRVAFIEGESFADPWSKQMILDSLHNPLCHAFVACCNEETIVGFVLTIVVEDESEIMDIAVSPNWRKQGIARRLLSESLSFAKNLGAESCYLEVRMSNESAKSVYLSLGFEIIGQRKNYYQHPKEDAVLMRYSFPRKDEK